MKVFYSWSGATSRKVALALRDRLKLMVQAIEPWISVDDIRKGTRPLTDISRELDHSNAGIICCTPDNLTSAWLLFEAGAIGKSQTDARVYVVRFHVSHSELADPLQQFQHTDVLDKQDMKHLVRTLNERAPEPRLTADQVNEVFETMWPKLEEELKQIEVPEDGAPTAEPPSPIEAKLELLIAGIRSLDRKIEPLIDDYEKRKTTKVQLELLQSAFSGNPPSQVIKVPPATASAEEVVRAYTTRFGPGFTPIANPTIPPSG